jgi:hypothetical protein
MLRKALSYGLLAGLIAGAPLFIVTLVTRDLSPSTFGMVLGYLTMLVALSIVFVAIKTHRDRQLGGTIGFWPAMSLGLAISFVAALIYVFAWEAALATSGVDFAGDYVRATLEQQKAKGLSAEALAKLAAELEQFKIQYANPLFRMPMTFIEIFPVGVLVSAISAGLLRNSRFMPARPL